MITACVPEALDIFYGSVIEKGWRDDLHKQFDDWLDTLEEDMRKRKGDEIARTIFEWDIQKAGTNLAAEVPYDKAEDLFKELTGLSMSNHVMHEVVGDICECTPMWGCRCSCRCSFR